MRIKTINLLFLACLSVPLFSNCITPKAYCGDKVSATEMFEIKGEKDKVNIQGKSYLEAALLVKVDSQTVGSFYKGWPKAVKVKAGERIVEIRHYKGWDATLNNKPTVELQTGACKIIPDYHKHYLVKFQADKEKKYKIAFKTKDPQKDTAPEVLLTEEDSGKQVNCVVELMDQNSLTQR